MKHKFVISIYYPRAKDETCVETLKKESGFEELAKKFSGVANGGGGTDWKLNDVSFEFTYLKDLVKFYKEARKSFWVKKAEVAVESEDWKNNEFKGSLYIPIERFI